MPDRAGCDMGSRHPRNSPPLVNTQKELVILDKRNSLSLTKGTRYPWQKGTRYPWQKGTRYPWHLWQMEGQNHDINFRLDLGV